MGKRARYFGRRAAALVTLSLACSTLTCQAFHSTNAYGPLILERAGQGQGAAAAAASKKSSVRLRSADEAAATDVANNSTESEAAATAAAAAAAVDWSRADTSTQIFPGGPKTEILGRTGAQEQQSGYFTSAPYSRTLRRAKDTRKMKKRQDQRKFPRTGRVLSAVLDKISGRRRANENEDGTDVQDDEDGYDLMYGTKHNKARHWLRHDGNAYYHNYEPRWKRLGKFVFRRRERHQVEPGQLILVRHGESQWNANKTFTGWADPDLSPQGYREVEYAARLLLESGYDIDMIFTSRLTRAIRSTWVLLQELNQVYLPVFKSWRLNERMVRNVVGSALVLSLLEIFSCISIQLTNCTYFYIPLSSSSTGRSRVCAKPRRPSSSARSWCRNGGAACEPGRPRWCRAMSTGRAESDATPICRPPTYR